MTAIRTARTMPSVIWLFSKPRSAGNRECGRRMAFSSQLQRFYDLYLIFLYCTQRMRFQFICSFQIFNKEITLFLISKKTGPKAISRSLIAWTVSYVRLYFLGSKVAACSLIAPRLRVLELGGDRQTNISRLWQWSPKMLGQATAYSSLLCARWWQAGWCWWHKD